MTTDLATDGLWELPSGWTWLSLGELGTWTGGGTPSKSRSEFWTGGTIPWVSPKDMKVDIIGQTEDAITPAAVDQSSTKRVPAGSVLMVMRSGILRHTFPVAVNDREVTLNQDLRALTPKSGINPHFVARYLKLSTHRILTECAKDGTTVDSIEATAIARLPIPLPLLAEQKRIMARIDELFAEIAEGEAALTRAREGLETFRRALLKSAVTGELTREWREMHSTDEDATARIVEIRQARSPREAGRRGRRTAVPSNRKLTLAAPIPSTWALASLDDLKSSDQRNGISIAGTSEPPGVKALRLDALGDTHLNLNAVRFIPLPEHRIADYRINPGDLLVSRANGSANLVGRAVFVEEAPDTVVFPDTIIRYPLGADTATGKWAALAWNSPIVRSQVLRLAKTTAGILKISQADIAEVTFPLPPKRELEEILRRVSDALAAHADTLALLDAEAADAARLRQAVLKAAFEGRLVPQDPDDEPASAMLERLANTDPRPKTNKRGRPRKT